MAEVMRFLQSCISSTFVFFILLYRSVFSLNLGPCCRYQPSCSQYALDALRQHTLWRALALIFNRVGSCRPGGGAGYDPVPRRDP